jgi:hypothetical protein
MTVLARPSSNLPHPTLTSHQTLIMGAQMIHEKSAVYNHLTRRIAREGSVNFRRHQSFRSYAYGKVFLCLISSALCHEDIWGSEGIASPFLTSALDGGEWSASRPCRFTPGRNSTRYPLVMRLGGPQGRSGSCGEEKNLALPASA